jgi:hypothetical protein
MSILWIYLRLVPAFRALKEYDLLTKPRREKEAEIAEKQA